MARNTQIQFRVSSEEKGQIQAQARTAEMKVSDYVRIQALQGGVAGSTGGSELPSAGSTPAPGSRSDLSKPETRKAVTDSVKVLEAKELTALARRRWPHLPLAVAEKKVRAET